MPRSQKFYEYFSGRRYEASFLGGAMRKKFHKLLSLFHPAAEDFNLLDVSCGPGEFLEKIHRDFPHAHLSGLDLSGAMVSYALGKIPAADVREGDALQLPWPEQTFDIVTNSLSFHHYPDPDKALAEMFRVLKPSGSLFLLDIHPKHRVTKMAIDFVARLFPEGHEHVFTQKEIRLLVEKAGFQEIRQVPFGLLSRLVLNRAEKP